MRSRKVSFLNDEGQTLVARLEMPVNQHPHTYALFAHCFSCKNNVAAIRYISRALSIRGIAVLRFDFAGLDDQVDETAQAPVAYQLSDLLAAARFLEQNYRAPAILIGHSLGGAAVISAAVELESVRAVATIGAPIDPGQVGFLNGPRITADEDEQENARVDLGRQPFLVKKRFLESIRETALRRHLADFNRALLILHAPQDKIVSVDNAAQLYQAARHPKSFISLDGADHLLLSEKDARYAGDVISAWAQRYISLPEQEELKVQKQVAVRLGKDERYVTDIMVRHHGITADEPESAGGNDFGPSPYELISSGLGACTAMTLQMYARRKKWDLREVVVHLEHKKDYAKDMEAIMEVEPQKIDHFNVLLELKGDLDEAQKERLLEIAGRCPVHRTLTADMKIAVQLIDRPVFSPEH